MTKSTPPRPHSKSTPAVAPKGRAPTPRSGDPSRRPNLDRDHVLRVAAALFRQRGFDRTTLRDIATACNCLLGSLYYRYPSKDSLLLDMMEQALGDGVARIRAAIAEAEDPREKFRIALRVHVREYAIENDMTFVLLHDWRGLSQAAQARMIELRDGYECFWDELLTSLARTGNLSAAVDRRLLRLLGMGALNSIAVWYRPGGDYTPEAIADFMWQSLMANAPRRTVEKGGTQKSVTKSPRSSATKKSAPGAKNPE